MPFDLLTLLAEHQGESFELHSRFMKPQLVRVLITSGFDRCDVLGGGSYLIDGNLGDAGSTARSTI